MSGTEILDTVERQAAAEIAIARKCSSCGRKPARIDDLCKKCARAQGIVVHGKV